MFFVHIDVCCLQWRRIEFGGRDGFFLNGNSALKGTGIKVGSVAHGDLASGLASALAGKNGPMVDRKVENIERALKRNPDGPVMLFGDTTTGDPKVFERLLKSENKDRIQYAFLPRVRGYPEPDAVKNHPKVVVFDEYSEVGRLLHDQGIISDRQLQEVINNR